MTGSPRWLQPTYGNKRRFYILAPILILVVFLVIVPRSRGSRWRKVAGNDNDYTPIGPAYRSSPGRGNSPRELAANATLGFQKFLALSTGPSWRTRGLTAAAKYTGLEVEIPAQTDKSPGLLEAFRKPGGQTLPKHGSATAWVAHLEMLRYIIANDWETAFIVEDDVDWDIRIFNQMRMFSDNVRQFLSTEVTDPRPYGGDWDVLWLGHCGELSHQEETRLLRYQDQTRPTTGQYGGWSKKMLRDWVPEGMRVVQEASQPVCTFGYGVTKPSAQKILDFLGEGDDEAYDVAVQHHCLQGDLRCITVNPEIMHHYEPDESHGYVSQVKEGDGAGQSADEADYEDFKGATSNIVHSARCKALFHQTCLAAPWEYEERYPRHNDIANRLMI